MNYWVTMDINLHIHQKRRGKKNQLKFPGTKLKHFNMCCAQFRKEILLKQALYITPYKYIYCTSYSKITIITTVIFWLYKMKQCENWHDYNVLLFSKELVVLVPNNLTVTIRHLLWKCIFTRLFCFTHALSIWFLIGYNGCFVKKNKKIKTHIEFHQMIDKHF